MSSRPARDSPLFGSGWLEQPRLLPAYTLVRRSFEASMAGRQDPLEQLSRALLMPRRVLCCHTAQHVVRTNGPNAFFCRQHLEDDGKWGSTLAQSTVSEAGYGLVVAQRQLVLCRRLKMPSFPRFAWGRDRQPPKARVVAELKELRLVVTDAVLFSGPLV